MQLAAELLEKFIRQFIALFSEMAPFLLLGFLLAGIIHVWIPNRLYIPKIAKSDLRSVLWAALFGIPLPICSCGVIPTAIALRREGASKGASVSFLISTPATGADSILATYSLLGAPFAILRPVAAFVTAIFGGALTNLATRGEVDGASPAACGPGEHCRCHEAHERHEHEEHTHESCCSGHCGTGAINKTESRKTIGRKLLETLEYGFVDMVGNVSQWLCIGLLLGAMIAAFVPDDFFLFLHDYPLLCMLAVLLLAMPMYTCATGSIPLALALVAKGMTPGAALVLLMAGPATSIASMLIIGKAFGKKTLFAYIMSIAAGAMAFGWIVDTFLMDTFLASMIPHGAAGAHGHEAVGIIDYACAALLGALMIYAKFSKRGSDHCGGGECDGKDKDGEAREEKCCCHSEKSF